jgi:hypothetical protein
MNQHGRAQAYILSVGGFLGIADRHVAINPSDLKVPTTIPTRSGMPQ